MLQNSSFFVYLVMHRKEGTNLIVAALAELTKLGYKPTKGKAKKNDLLCATRVSKDLWIELDNHTNISTAAHLVLRKAARK